MFLLYYKTRPKKRPPEVQDRHHNTERDQMGKKWSGEQKSIPM